MVWALGSNESETFGCAQERQRLPDLVRIWVETRTLPGVAPESARDPGLQSGLQVGPGRFFSSGADSLGRYTPSVMKDLLTADEQEIEELAARQRLLKAFSDRLHRLSPFQSYFRSLRFTDPSDPRTITSDSEYSKALELQYISSKHEKDISKLGAAIGIGAMVFIGWLIFVMFRLRSIKEFADEAGPLIGVFLGLAALTAVLGLERMKAAHKFGEWWLIGCCLVLGGTKTQIATQYPDSAVALSLSSVLALILLFATVVGQLNRRGTAIVGLVFSGFLLRHHIVSQGSLISEAMLPMFVGALILALYDAFYNERDDRRLFVQHRQNDTTVRIEELRNQIKDRELEDANVHINMT